MFQVKFKTDNAAFEGPFLQEETTRILQALIKLIERGHTGGAVRDVNGNTVGQWSLR